MPSWALPCYSSGSSAGPLLRCGTNLSKDGVSPNGRLSSCTSFRPVSLSARLSNPPKWYVVADRTRLFRFDGRYSRPLPLVDHLEDEDDQERKVWCRHCHEHGSPVGEAPPSVPYSA